MNTLDTQTIMDICIKMKYPFSSEIIKKKKVWLRGFLLNPDVMKAWWGEEKVAVCWYCGEVFPETKEGYKKHPKVCSDFFGNPYQKGTRNVYKKYAYHAQQLVLLPTDSLLTYYRENKKG